ncbi:GUN4 domain-containing protein [Pseudanabaena sp. 'Roaring Creek']|uniref:GUN4 domain-containing protein n=1 Tax=Pseudanabaena sp. 'Roaring Creek' TaxID=1681830 RepID=UPI0006D79C63|nr:GUN4 domain-containing protein [Pseudanabaena sp. 'Roaring Creek']
MLYSHHQTLQDLLVVQNWHEADLETKRLTFQINPEELWGDYGLSERHELIPKIKAFSKEELEEIDRLWVEHSNGHFGFSVQWQVYQELLDELRLENELREDNELPDINFDDIDFDNLSDKELREKIEEIEEKKRTPIQKKYRVRGRWSSMAALAILLGWLSNGASEWRFDRETMYTIDSPKGHLPTLGKQELGCAFHHGYMLDWVFDKLYLKPQGIRFQI